MQREIYKYSTGSVACEGLVARKANLAIPAPVVVLFHHWCGRDALMDSNSERIANMGAIAFAADLYGGHTTAVERDACAALMNPFIADRAMLRERLRATVAAAQRIPGADGQKIVVIGYCFGGLCAFDCARANLPGVLGVAGFHGLFTPPNLGPQAPIAARVLALHGYDDPMAPPDAVLGFAKEMTAAGARWELDAYGQTVHAFTNPQALDRAAGVHYDELACTRAYARVEGFLKECFATP